MELIKAEEAKQITDINNSEYKDEIQMLNTLIKDRAEHGLRTCEVNIKLIPSVLEELDRAGYAIYNIEAFGRKIGKEKYYILKW